MKYIGSKNRIAKHILPIMLKYRTPEMTWVEPFVGGANMIDKVEGKRIGLDINKKLISLLKELQNGWIPPMSVSEEFFNKVKKSQDEYDAHLVAYMATQLSYGAVWFCAYRRDYKGARNYAIEAYNNVIKQTPKLNGIEFYHSDYRDFNYPDNSLIYCDPVYDGSDIGAYRGNIDKFDNKAFWEWCRQKAKQGHKVFVSEYNAPDDFECIWSMELKQVINNTLKTGKVTEKLFTPMVL